MLNECFSVSAGAEQCDNGLDVTICAFVVVPQELDGVGDTKVIVEEAHEESVGLVIAEGVLGHPAEVVVSKPAKAVPVQVYAHTQEV